MDNYSKIRTVGRGAYGIVNLYRRKTDGSLVIIKEIPVEEMTLEERQGALNEVKVLDMLDHPNIIKYFDSFFADKALMIAMEYAEGGTIFEYLQARNGELIDEPEVMCLFVQMVLSLKAIHALNVLHRDLKTQNVMLDRKKKVVKVGDFGISKVLTSKSKANTVVGTPCYISPELCEGKPYDEKSDIWALGCVLYEIASLRKAFDAANLPALVLKIMRGMFAPISDVYSEDLRKLILSMLHLDPHQRPSLDEILSQPICQIALINLHTDVGRLPCFGAGNEQLTLSRKADSHEKSPKQKQKGISKRQSPFTIMTWGLGVTRPVQLLGLTTQEISSLHISRTQHLAITSNGEVSAWKSSHAKRLVREQQSDPRWAPTPYPGLSGIVIQQVVSGTSFAAFRSDRGILMTHGSGALGCLGHGDYEDVRDPRIVESVLGFEIANISAGAAHMAVTTREGEVYTWGCGENGRLALGNDEGQCCPQLVKPYNDKDIALAYCGDDCTFFLDTSGTLMASGSNRHNKAGLNNKANLALESSSSTSGMMVSAEEAHMMIPIKCSELESSVVSVACGISHTAVLTDSGAVYTFGSNTYGQLGRSYIPAPTRVEIPAKIKQIACGDNFTFALTEENKLFGWGKATEGRIPGQTSDCLVEPTEIQLHKLASDLEPNHCAIQHLVCKFNVTMVCMKNDDGLKSKS